MTSLGHLALWLIATFVAYAGFVGSPKALEPETELARVEVSDAVSEIMQRFVTERQEKDSAQPRLTASLAFSKGGRQPPTDSGCMQNLSRQFEDQIAAVARDIGLQISVGASGSATVAFVMGDINGPRANPSDVPWQAWFSSAEARHGSSVRRFSDRDKFLSDPSETLTGLYRMPDRTLMYGQAILDWDSWPLAGSRSQPVWHCQMNFIRAIVALSTLALHERLRHQIADIRDRAQELAQLNKIVDQMRNATVSVEIDDLMNANMFCWQFSQSGTKEETAACATRLAARLRVVRLSRP